MLMEDHSGALVDGPPRDVSADNTDAHAQHAMQRLFESGVLLSEEERVLIQKTLHHVRVCACVRVCVCVRACVWHVRACLRADTACESRITSNG